MIRRALHRGCSAIVRSRRGGVIVEFAIVAPVLLLMIIGSLETGHTLYVKAVLQGVVQKAARDSTLQASNTQAAADALDLKVRDAVKGLDAQITDASISIKRRYYRDYLAASAHQFEPYNDANNDKRCDNGEAYTDSNSNGVWDADGADAGGGGAQDKAIYTVAVSYPRLFPMQTIVGGSATVELVATTILANQPYAEQATYKTPISRLCP